MTQAGKFPISFLSKISQRMPKTDLLSLNLGPIEITLYLLLKLYKGTCLQNTAAKTNVTEEWRSIHPRGRKDGKFKVGFL